jgi:hypothetical protein
MRVGDDLTTTLRVAGNAAFYVVTTRDPVCQERIVHMGWLPDGENRYVRKLSATPDVARIHGNFRRHLIEMVLQSARLRPIPWDIALAEFLRRVEGSGLGWWLYGSGALAVRGADIVPGDLDFAVDNPHRAGELFRDLLVEPVTGPLDWEARWIGRAFCGALFEWSAEATAAEPNEFSAGTRLETVVWRGHQVPVPALDLQLTVTEQRGLTARAALIRRLMRA